MATATSSLKKMNTTLAPKGRLGAPARATEDFVEVNESLVNGSPREVFTGTPEKTGKITQTGVNILTAGQAPKLAEKAGNFAKNVDKTTRDFFSKLDPTKTKIEAASTSGIDKAQQGISGSGARAAGLAKALQSNPTMYNIVRARDPGAASQVALPEQVQAGQIQAGQAEAMMVDPAQIAALERAQAAAIERGDEQGVRASQMALAQALEAQAAGTGPSLAEQQLARQNEQAIKQQLALAGSQRGMTPAMAQRQAAMNIGTLAAEQGARAAELRIQEQQAARAQLADVLGQTRGLDVNIASQQAQLQQQAALQNAAQFNQQASQQAQLEQQAGLANQGEFGQTQRFNVGTALQADTANVANALQASQFNVTAGQNAQQFNAKAADEMARFSADAGLRASIANQAAQLQATGMDQAQIARLLGIEQASLSSVLSSETEKFKAEQARLTGQQQNEQNVGGNILSTVGSVIALCFPAGEQVLMADESYKAIEDVVVGDILSESMVTEVRKYVSREPLYKFAGATATAKHAVWDGVKWQAFEDVGMLVGDPQERDVYALVTSTGVFIVGDALVGDDEHDADDLNAMERKFA